MSEISPDQLSKLADYWAGALPARERQEVQEWLSSNHDIADALKLLEVGRIDMKSSANDGINSDEVLSGMVQRVISSIESEEYTSTMESSNYSRISNSVTLDHSAQISKSTYLSKRWLGIAAIGICAVIMILIDGIGLPVYKQSIVYSTANGKRGNVVLSDGSTVVLNVGTAIEISSRYGSKDRRVNLRGSALFNVKQASANPFIVVAGNSTTKVLGTKFLVRYYDTDSAASVAVSEGKVAVGSEVLTRNESVQVFETGSISQKIPVNSSQSVFDTNVLVLDPMPLSQAMHDLNRWYDVNIKIGDAKIGETIISGQFPIGSTADLIERLASSLSVNVVLKGRLLTIYSQKL